MLGLFVCFCFFFKRKLFALWTLFILRSLQGLFKFNILFSNILLVLMLYNCNTTISRDIIKHNDELQRTNTLLCKNIPLTLYSRKGWCWFCVRGELETGTDCYILLPSSSDHSWAAQPWNIEGPKPSVCRWLSIRHLVPNRLQLELTQAVCSTWLYNCLTPTCFCCSSAYLHSCISWLTAPSRVNI